MVRLAAYGSLTCAAAAYVVFSAFRQRSNFFAAAVYLSKSNASMMILWNFGVFLTILVGKAVQTIFFGPLRLIEIERLHERAWYAVTESLLALTIFREAFDTSFVILFVSLLFLKIFHWLASDRVEMMEQAPSIPRTFHLRMLTVLSSLWFIDLLLVAIAADSILTDGPSVMIMFASEYMIMLATLVGTSLKYGANAYDLRNDHPWENKSVFVFYVELACDFLKLATYLCFFSLILTFYGLPLNILRDVYITARSFVQKIRDLSRYRQATRNMEQRYPAATAEEMERLSDKTCIICREDMEARTEAQQQARDTRQPNETPKKLPCGHIFHFHCLRSWLERQQSCPTCRRPVLGATFPLDSHPRVAAPPAAAPNQAAVAPANRPTPTATQPPAPQPGTIPHSRSDTSVHLSVPPPSQNRSSSPTPSTTSRRRAGPENPLVAFQLRSAPKPPAPLTQASSKAAEAAKEPSRTESGIAQTTTAQQPTRHSHPHLDTSVTLVPGSATGLDTSAASAQELQRRQRLEAALRRRGVLDPKITGAEGSSITTVAEAPAIKVDEVAASTAALGEKSPPASSTPKTIGPDTSTLTLGDQSDLVEPTPAAQPSLPAGNRTSNFESSLPLESVRETIDLQIPLLQQQHVDPLPSTDELTEHERSNMAGSAMPRLIPLFDISNPSKPGPLARFFPSLAQSGLWRDASRPSSSLPAETLPSNVRLPEGLDDSQLATLAEITREGMETRLKLLNSTQQTLQACIDQMQQAMKVLSAGDVQAALQVVSELGAKGLGMAADTKGKGKSDELSIADSDGPQESDLNSSAV